MILRSVAVQLGTSDHHHYSTVAMPHYRNSERLLGDARTVDGEMVRTSQPLTQDEVKGRSFQPGLT